MKDYVVQSLEYFGQYMLSAPELVSRVRTDGNFF